MQYNMEEEIYNNEMMEYYESQIEDMDTTSDGAITENYFDYFFGEGVPRYPWKCVRYHSNRLDYVYWAKYYDFNTPSDWWGYKLLCNAALLEKKLYVPVISCSRPFHCFSFYNKRAFYSPRHVGSRGPVL